MNIIEVLDAHSIPYITSGKNVKRGCVNIKCPFCGEADRSSHLGINLSTGMWACWRNVEHRGGSPHRLLMKLLGCSYEAIQALLVDTSDLRTIADRLTVEEKDNDEESTEDTHTEYEPGIVPLSDKPIHGKDKPIHGRFFEYLTQRGFDYPHIYPMTSLYDLHCALIGQFKNRIIFPIHVNDRLIGYTGRCVDGGRLRYLSSGPAIKRHLLWHDLLLQGGRRLWVVEGPFDALKIDYISRRIGLPDRATCLFNVNPTESQLDELCEMAGRFDSVSLLFDRSALHEALLVQKMLFPTHIGVSTLPDGVDDPGELSWSQVHLLYKKEAKRQPAWTTG